MQTISEQKKKLREHYTKLRSSWSAEERNIISAAAAENVMKLYRQSGAQSLFCYVSVFPVELDTTGLLESALAAGISTAVPLCLDKKGHMRFYRICGFSELKAGCFGIPEPDPSLCSEAVSDRKTLCIVPGLSFDRSGKRLGFGGGYYDRFLADFPGITAGLCAESCMSEALPCDEYDIAVDYVLTEKRMICISGGGAFCR